MNGNHPSRGICQFVFLTSTSLSVNQCDSIDFANRPGVASALQLNNPSGLTLRRNLEGVVTEILIRHAVTSVTNQVVGEICARRITNNMFLVVSRLLNRVNVNITRNVIALHGLQETCIFHRNILYQTILGNRGVSSATNGEDGNQLSQFTSLTSSKLTSSCGVGPGICAFFVNIGKHLNQLFLSNLSYIEASLDFIDMEALPTNNPGNQDSQNNNASSDASENAWMDTLIIIVRSCANDEGSDCTQTEGERNQEQEAEAPANTRYTQVVTDSKYQASNYDADNPTNNVSFKVSFHVSFSFHF